MESLRVNQKVNKLPKGGRTEGPPAKRYRRYLIALEGLRFSITPDKNVGPTIPDWRVGTIMPDRKIAFADGRRGILAPRFVRR